jgi:hypothetical protein
MSKQTKKRCHDFVGRWQKCQNHVTVIVTRSFLRLPDSPRSFNLISSAPHITDTGGRHKKDLQIVFGSSQNGVRLNGISAALFLVLACSILPSLWSSVFDITVFKLDSAREL